MKIGAFLLWILLLSIVVSCKKELYDGVNPNGIKKQGLSNLSATPGLPSSLSGYNVVPAYVDEFNSINNSEWMYRNGYAGNSIGGGSKPSLVTAHNDTLHIAYKKIADTLDGGGLLSKHLFGYGYYTIKAKLYNATAGLHQSFWSIGVDDSPYYTTPQTDSLPYFNNIQEIDGFEVESETTNIIGQNFHTGYPTKVDYAHSTSGHNTAVWFTAGFEWVPGKIRYYINGAKVDSLSYQQTYSPASILITALPRPNIVSRYPNGIPDPSPGAEMLVDYVQYYNKEMDNVNLIGNASFEYNNQFAGHTKYSSFVNHPLSWIVSPNITYTVGASQLHADVSGTDTLWRLQLGSSGAYQTLTHQNLEYIPNGYYTLTAHVKASTSAPVASLQALPNTFLTGTLPSLPDSLKANMALTPNQWTPIVIPNIHVTNGNLSVALYANGLANQTVLIDSLDLENVNNHQVLVDNSGSGFTTSDTSWISYTSVPGFYGSNYLAVPGAGHWAQWTPNIPSTGSYNVYMRWTANSNRSSAIPITIYASGNTSTVTINQQIKGAAWVYLGTYNMSGGTSNYVKLNTTANWNVADAVLFVKN